LEEIKKNKKKGGKERLQKEDKSLKRCHLKKGKKKSNQGEEGLSNFPSKDGKLREVKTVEL